VSRRLCICTFAFVLFFSSTVLYTYELSNTASEELRLVVEESVVLPHAQEGCKECSEIVEDGGKRQCGWMMKQFAWKQIVRYGMVMIWTGKK